MGLFQEKDALLAEKRQKIVYFIHRNDVIYTSMKTSTLKPVRGYVQTLLEEQPAFALLSRFFNPQETEQNWHLRELSRATSLNARTVTTYTSRFVKEKILKKTVLGNKHVFSANLDSPIARELSQFFSQLNTIALPGPAKQVSPKRLYWYTALVERVVDGHAFVGLVDLGFQTLRRLRIRIARMDAPPPGSSYSAEGQIISGNAIFEAVREQIEGKEILIKTYGTDRYGSRLADVYVNDQLLVRYLNEKFGLPILNLYEWQS